MKTYWVFLKSGRWVKVLADRYDDFLNVEYRFSTSDDRPVGVFRISEVAGIVEGDACDETGPN